MEDRKPLNTQSTDCSRGSCFFRGVSRTRSGFRLFLQALQLASDHAGVFRRAQRVDLRCHPPQPRALQSGFRIEQTPGLFTRIVEVVRMKISATHSIHSLALKVTSSPLRHLAALAVTAFRVLVRPSCSCSLAANTVTTLWPSLNRIA